VKKVIISAILVLLNTLANAKQPSQIKLYCDKSQSSITYSMHHPLHSWTGESKDVTSVILTDEDRNLISQVAVLVKISSFDSKNANRDSHVMEVTEALTYPTISFNSTLIKQENNKLTVTGTLKFHDISQPITFEAEKNTANNKAEITGHFTVQMTQFNIKPPSLMGAATDDEIKLAFKVIY
jgi:polyisoprenoid-binding protein YceI